MSWRERLALIEASTQRIKARLLRCIAAETGQTEAQVWAGLVRDREKRLSNAAS